METRQGAELRALSGTNIAGVAMRYDIMGRTSGGRRERFLPGAFGQIPAEMSLTLQHDPDSVVGRVNLFDSVTELRAEGTVSPSVHGLIRRRLLNGFSVEFDVTDEATVPDFGASVREVRGALLGGLSVVQVPAHPASRLEARARIGSISGRLPLGKKVDCTCRFAGRNSRRQAIVEEIDLSEAVPGYLFDVKRPLALVTATRTRGAVNLEIAIDDELSYAADALALGAAGVTTSIRPFPDLQRSKMTRDGDLDVYEMLVPIAWIVVPESLAGDLPTAKVKREARGLSRRRRIVLAGLA